MLMSTELQDYITSQDIYIYIYIWISVTHVPEDAFHTLPVSSPKKPNRVTSRCEIKL